MSAKLATKMVLAMKAIDAVTKSGRNETQKYNYVKAADVANEVRKALIANGVAFLYDVVESKNWEGTTKSGGTMYFCQLTVNAIFIDQESGEQFSGRVVGIGADSMDKAAYKAMTGALKYALRMTFLIPDEAADPETQESHEMKPAVKIITRERSDALRKLFREKNIDKEKMAEVLKGMGVQAFGELNSDQADEVRDWMEGE